MNIYNSIKKYSTYEKNVSYVRVELAEENNNIHNVDIDNNGIDANYNETLDVDN